MSGIEVGTCQTYSRYAQCHVRKSRSSCQPVYVRHGRSSTQIQVPFSTWAAARKLEQHMVWHIRPAARKCIHELPLNQPCRRVLPVSRLHELTSMLCRSIGRLCSWPRPAAGTATMTDATVPGTPNAPHVRQRDRANYVPQSTCTNIFAQLRCVGHKCAAIS